MWNEKDWAFTRDDTGMCIDARHVRFIYDLCMACDFTSALEIGSYMGFSASAFVQAIKDGKHLSLTMCDLNFRAQLRQLFFSQNTRGQMKPFFQGDSLEAMKESAGTHDLIFVDGNHELKQVSRELGYLLINETPTILAHDVGRCHNIGDVFLSDKWFVGSEYLGKVIGSHPAYRTLIDEKKREGEYTHRGFLFATRLQEVWEKAKRLWEKMVA